MGVFAAAANLASPAAVAAVKRAGENRWGGENPHFFLNFGRQPQLKFQNLGGTPSLLIYKNAKLWAR